LLIFIVNIGNMIMGESNKVLILGYGEMGHAMEYLLTDHHRLFIWDKFPSAGFQSVGLYECIPRADVIIFCLPVNPHREVVEQIKPLLYEHSVCLSIAKGLDENGQTDAQIFEHVLHDRRYALLYGSMISEEIRSGRYAFAQVGCRDDVVYQQICNLFSKTRLFTEQTHDIAGISWSVILKNVYAMMFGVADELQLGDNMRGFLMVAALHELGRMMARGETENIAGEGVHTLQMVEKHHLLNMAMYPLFRLIQQIVKQPEQVSKKIDVFIQENQKSQSIEI